ncbi:hypothetical protein QU522_09940 [Klebsiella pneumoniae subsp. pneumoniae]|nr:hypothetical protein [Klebsiella pneumoniae]WKA68929.1 hypothetical protein QU522_09940 [Klebsiella pneumoniae subsp. pneumoniae]
MKANRINHGDLRTLTPAQAITYLEQRGEQVGQKTLDMERQAIQAMGLCRQSAEYFPGVVLSRQPPGGQRWRI